MEPPKPEEEPISSGRIPTWRLIFDQSFFTQPVLDHNYAGSGTEEDPYLISWIPDDPRDPLSSLTETSKWAIILLVSVSALTVSLVSSAYTGGLVEVTGYFQISEEVAFLGITLFVIGFALGPLLWAPLSEIYGRRYILIITSMGLTAFTAGAAGANNLQTLLILRFLGGSFGSAPLAVAGGVLADIFPPISRGLASGIFAAAPFLGPTLGPIVGGFLAESAGWRWVEGLLAALSGTVWIATCLLLPETYGPLLLEKRAAKLSAVTGQVYRSSIEVGQARQTISTKLCSALSRPWVLLFRESIVFLLSLYIAIIYGILYMFFAAFPIVFQKIRGWSEGIGGLAFLGILLGILLSIVYVFPTYFAYKKRTLQLPPRSRLPPEARLPDSFLPSICLPVSLFWFAWTNDPSVHWMAPIAAGVPFGFGMIMVFLPVLNYLVDAYTIYAASVLAANSLLRSIFGAVFPLFTSYMYQDLGIHWASSIPAFLALACAPMPFLFYKFGATIRRRCHYAAEADAFMQRLLGSQPSRTQEMQKSDRTETNRHRADSKTSSPDSGVRVS
ncbi:major facilitator superfamily domain-containing protein [Aspergillus ambiguus]|uniref:MFS transporter n=1 Tax=Aspergillus ambiguus TaxID=176160 RepID=UPI003CCDAD70